MDRPFFSSIVISPVFLSALPISSLLPRRPPVTSPPPRRARALAFALSCVSGAHTELLENLQSAASTQTKGLETLFAAQRNVTSDAMRVTWLLELAAAVACICTTADASQGYGELWAVAVVATWVHLRLPTCSCRIYAPLFFPSKLRFVRSFPRPSRCLPNALLLPPPPKPCSYVSLPSVSIGAPVFFRHRAQPALQQGGQVSWHYHHSRCGRGVEFRIFLDRCKHFSTHNRNTGGKEREEKERWEGL